MKKEIESTILKINQRVEHINTSTGIDEVTKHEILNFLSKAKANLREAKYYIALAEESFAFGF